ncbi:MAG: ComEC/Rec2 family competence protein [Verrucomicrobiae bacterium]|nr:ComEC/Rec2 family competence protein [Verrucomicrobiae bacterium]
MKNRPLLFPALCFAAGILAEEESRIGPGWWLATAVVCLGLAWVPGWLGSCALWMGWGLAGGLAQAIHVHAVSPADLRRLTGEEPRLVELRGWLSESPSPRLRERDGQWSSRTLVRMEVSAWRPERGVWAPAAGSVMTATRGVIPETLFRGHPAQVTGVLEAPRSSQAPGLFDYRRHLEHQDIHRILEVGGVEDWQVTGDSAMPPPWSERFLPWARRALANGLPDDESTRLLWAMALGWRAGLSGGVETAFMESGTMHVFAISGLHIALIAALLIALLRALRLPRPAGVLIAVPLLWFYVAATGWQPSAERSAIMMTVVAGTWVWNRPGDLLNSLGLAALVLLVREPGQLLQPGFQLSFAVVAVLAVLVPVIEPWILARLQFYADPFLPEAMRPRWQRILDPPIRHLASGLAVGIAAFLSSLPLTVNLFHLFSPVSIAANLLVVPLSSLSLAACAASILFSPVWPDLAGVFNASAWLWMHLMVALSRAFATLPGGVWYVAAPSWIWWIPYAILLLALAAVRPWPPIVRRRVWIGAGVMAVLAGVAFAAGASSRPRWRITCLPGGDALVVDAPGRRRDLVMNTGGARSGPAMVTPFLRSQGWNSVPVLVLSQPDAQRAGDAPEFLRRFRPGIVAVPEGRLRSPAFRTALERCKAFGIPVRQLAAGDLLCGWTVLNPPAGRVARSMDEASLALAGSFGGIRVLLLSNPGRKAQRFLLDRPEALRADILVAGLPRDRQALLPELLEAVQPRLIVMTTAAMPATAHAGAELRARLGESGIPVYFTEDAGGAVELELGPAGAVARRGGRELHRIPAQR